MKKVRLCSRPVLNTRRSPAWRALGKAAPEKSAPGLPCLRGGPLPNTLLPSLRRNLRGGDIFCWAAVRRFLQQCVLLGMLITVCHPWHAGRWMSIAGPQRKARKQARDTSDVQCPAAPPPGLQRCRAGRSSSASLTWPCQMMLQQEGASAHLAALSCPPRRASRLALAPSASGEGGDLGLGADGTTASLPAAAGPREASCCCSRNTALSTAASKLLGEGLPRMVIDSRRRASRENCLLLPVSGKLRLPGSPLRDSLHSLT